MADGRLDGVFVESTLVLKLLIVAHARVEVKGKGLSQCLAVLDVWLNVPFHNDCFL